GGVPLSEAAILRALELNGVAVEANKKAFELGRLAASQPQALATDAAPREQAIVVHMPESLSAVVSRFRQELAAYQDEAYADRYVERVERVRAAELSMYPQGRPRLALAVARSLYKLMAYKDEYEVARLYTNGAFRQQLKASFGGNFTLRFHLAPPLFAPRDPHTGRPRKISLGPATESVFKILARCKGLRGSWLDVFSYTAERRLERQLIKDYEGALDALLPRLTPLNYQSAIDLAELPQSVRGFGYIKEAAARSCQAQLRAFAHPEADSQNVNNILQAHS